VMNTERHKQIAKELLEAAADDADYARMRRTVREMGLNPDLIRHTNPSGEEIIPEADNA
jgi:hypothetical protein